MHSLFAGGGDFAAALNSLFSSFVPLLHLLFALVLFVAGFDVIDLHLSKLMGCYFQYD